MQDRSKGGKTSQNIWNDSYMKCTLCLMIGIAKKVIGFELLPPSNTNEPVFKEIFPWKSVKKVVPCYTTTIHP